MPRIFDNLKESLLPILQQTLDSSVRADFCIGYFNLRGWRALAEHVEHFEGKNGRTCRVLIGMHRSESDEVRQMLRIDRGIGQMDQGEAKRLQRDLAEELRQQLTYGAPTNTDEAALRQLARQIRAGKVQVRLFLKHALHAKLYLCYPEQVNLPAVGFVGSSNLTFSGLSGQGELNVDVLEHDATAKLAVWFEDRWTDRWSLDVSTELAEIIETSWAREEPVSPYLIYLKIAHELARSTQLSQGRFDLPKDLRSRLFDYQVEAVKTAAGMLDKQRGVVIGDVVGLGKTLMATALARHRDDTYADETLIVCPRNLVSMWRDYAHTYGLRRYEVLPLSKVDETRMDNLRRYTLVLIDESHNLRNREAKRYRFLRDYVQRNESRCILLTATPYNKAHLDLSSQLRLFLDDERDLGMRPEALIRSLGDAEFTRRFGEMSPRSLKAFEQSAEVDDWRDLLRLFLVRRTRSHIKQYYALSDCPVCATPLRPVDDGCSVCDYVRTPESRVRERFFLPLHDGGRSYFPNRIPRTVRFTTDDPHDPYARLYADDVVDTIGGLHLPRYGLGGYVVKDPSALDPSGAEAAVLDGLSRAGHRLKGFSRTNLFKRLESSGDAFLKSVERHALRNLILVHALERGDPIPIGTQDAHLLDPDAEDADASLFDASGPDEAREDSEEEEAIHAPGVPTEASLCTLAERIYASYRGPLARRFTWMRAGFFRPTLKKHLLADAHALLNVLAQVGAWQVDRDAKVRALIDLVTAERHGTDKVLVFTQFADTALYLERALKGHGIAHVAAVTGSTDAPTDLAHRFSPRSNGKTVPPSQEIRVLIATDVLSEGQNLQDAHIVVNFDLPWALIRLVQRAGRVDRIGQEAQAVFCYSFMPAEGVNKIIRLRERVQQRLMENAEIVGSDERFFEGADASGPLLDLYNEKAGALDGRPEDEGEVDLGSQALAIWQAAVQRDRRVQKLVEDLPDVVYSGKTLADTQVGREGVLVYVRTALGTDALSWLDRTGQPVTQSPILILKAAECAPDTPAVPRLPEHHSLVRQGVERAEQEGHLLAGGALGKRTGARYRTYERLSGYLREYPVLVSESARRTLAAIYSHPLLESATGTLNDALRSSTSDEDLLALAVALHADERLVAKQDADERRDPHIICSLSLVTPPR
ncbi:MAG: phospholipase D-like domain-containing protein [Bacteroidetes bacterium]|nr:phospholipase D-like domain-containing protein [Bacteroidota bacterium]